MYDPVGVSPRHAVTVPGLILLSRTVHGPRAAGSALYLAARRYDPHMPTARARTRHIVSTSAVAVVALLGVTLGACGSSEDPDEGTTSSGSPAGEPSASAADPKGRWHPAKEDGGQFLVPPDWAVEESDTGLNLLAPPKREGGVRVGGGSFGSNITIDSEGAIDDAGDTALEFHKSGGMDAKRLPDVTLGGVKFYHVRGESSAEWLDDYGTVNDGKLITVLWTFNREMVDRKQVDEMLNQVMPTFTPMS